MDALRNLFLQANLIGMPKLSNRILDMGFITILESMIGKSVNQISFEKQKPTPDQR